MAHGPLPVFLVLDTGGSGCGSWVSVDVLVLSLQGWGCWILGGKRPSLFSGPFQLLTSCYGISISLPHTRIVFEKSVDI